MTTPSPLKLERIATRDGTATLGWKGTELSHRSLWGAQTESERAFLRGTRVLDRSGPWLVGELGFGAGTNFAALASRALEHQVELEYWAVERAPVPESLLCADGPSEALAREAVATLAAGALDSVSVSSGPITLHLHRGDWINAPLPGELSAIFFDPFAPVHEPESWSTDAFVVAASCLADDGVLATCHAGDTIRAAMMDAGLVVSGLPDAGPLASGLIAGLSPEAIAHGDRDLPA